MTAHMYTLPAGTMRLDEIKTPERWKQVEHTACFHRQATMPPSDHMIKKPKESLVMWPVRASSSFDTAQES